MHFDRAPSAPRYGLETDVDGVVTMTREGRPMWARWKKDGSGEIEFSEGVTDTWKALALEVRGPTVPPTKYVTRFGPTEEK